jgi:uncharacterized cupredoxin-like copper-binding protein
MAAGDRSGARGLLSSSHPRRKDLVNTLVRRAALALFSSVLLTAASGAAMAATTIHVSLWDKGADMQMVTGMEYEPGKTIDMSKATMGIKAMPDQAKAGVVTFKVTNNSKDTIHEMIVMQLDANADALPYIASENTVDEDTAGDKGEVSELDPGASGSLTVNLKAGKYLLICNVPGHYASGMWTQFTVTQ